MGKVNADALIRQDGVELLKIEMEKEKRQAGWRGVYSGIHGLRAVLDRYGWQLPAMG